MTISLARYIVSKYIGFSDVARSGPLRHRSPNRQVNERGPAATRDGARHGRSIARAASRLLAPRRRTASSPVMKNPAKRFRRLPIEAIRRTKALDLIKIQHVGADQVVPRLPADVGEAAQRAAPPVQGQQRRFVSVGRQNGFRRSRGPARVERGGWPDRRNNRFIAEDAQPEQPDVSASVERTVRSVSARRPR